MTQTQSKILIKNGEVKFLHSEGIMSALGKVGSTKIRRISDIWFDNGSGRWKIKVDSNNVKKDFATRQKAIDWEHEYINKRLNKYKGGT